MHHNKTLALSRSAPKRMMAALAVAGCCAIPAGAAEFQTSGFASLAAGRTFGACSDDVGIAARFTRDCTRFIADWSHAGVYESHWTATPESRVGVQGTVLLDDRWSGTAQAVLRSNATARASLEWAYLTFKPSSDWSLYLGRKRLPLFHFSDFQDVGYAYTWLRPPPDVYGWDVVNYNGASARWQSSLGELNLGAEVFAGRESSRDNAYSELLYDAQPKTVKWTRLRGLVLEAGQASVTARAVWIENDYQQIDQTLGRPDVLNSGRTRGRQRITGVSLNVDADGWLVHGEYSVFDRGDFQYRARAHLLAVGHRFGRFTPMLTASAYRETTPFADYAPLSLRSQAVTLRYELTDSVALKLQVDRVGERSPQGDFVGRSRAVSVGLDTVF